MDECGAIVDSSTVSKGSVNPVPALRCGCVTGNWSNDQAYYRCRFPAEYAGLLHRPGSAECSHSRRLSSGPRSEHELSDRCGAQPIGAAVSCRHVSELGRSGQVLVTHDG